MPKETKTKLKFITITKASELQKAVDAPVNCDFKLDGQNYRLPVERMTAVTFEAVRALRRSALPPWKKERNAHDELDPKYIEAVALNEKRARSVILYSHCPAISSEHPGLTDHDMIHDHVKKFFTEHILETISLTIQAGGLERIEERVDFTSPPGSES